MLTARERIERQMNDPSLVRLHRKLTRLTSTVTMMNTGAHPDDEQNGLLAWLRFGLGMRVIIACSTRGEGGQNALGPERLGALGVIRSRELEEAARVIDADISWLGHGPGDAVHDFGFSKDGDATFARWGELRTVERLVRSYRTERPDIVVPTFLDVPGQHGHHRAMTRAAEEAIRLAADPAAFPEHFEQGLMPWQVAKYYLPAWSGGGSTYDDEVPPPETTITVAVDGKEPASGADYDRIGEWSRYYHASQGMGHWPRRPDKSWPLHLKLSAIPLRKEASILDDLPSSMKDLARFEGLSVEAAETLRAVDADIAAAMAAFPDRRLVTSKLIALADRLDSIPSLASEDFLRRHFHRIERKQREVDAALLEAAAIFERAYADPPTISPGGTSTLTVELSDTAAARDIHISPILPAGVQATAQSSHGEHRFLLTAAEETGFSALYLPDWHTLGGNGHGYVKVSADIDGRKVSGLFDLEEPFSVSPANSLELQPDAVLVPTGSAPQNFAIKAEMQTEGGNLSFRTPQGWAMRSADGSWRLVAEEEPRAGLVEILPEIDGRPAYHNLPISYHHIGRTVFRQPAALKILALDLKLPEGARVGYVGGGADRVGLWLARMGLDVTELDAHALEGDLSRFTTIVIGIFAFGLRQDLQAATRRLHRFVEDGGHLVTLYHRPADGWRPEAIPVRRIDIGFPSLRWRVTDPAAEVTVLAPTHVLLNGPNVIGPQDWQGWNKERGLYFASNWDDHYQPLLAMHDVDEQPLKGALLSGLIGKGRHTHVSLVLHHQMDRLVPGAFRLMANLVQPM